MALNSGTIKGVVCLNAPTMIGRKAYLVTADFPANVGGTDTVQLTAVGATIAAHTRNGRTVTIRAAACTGAGKDSASLDVYAAGSAGVYPLTVAADVLSGILSTQTAATQTSAACKGVQFIVFTDEA